MKIYIPFKIRDIGGTATFIKKFSEAAKKNGATVSYDFSFDFDVLFIVGDCPISQYIQSLFIAKVLGKKIVQRLDGIYTATASVGKWYHLYNFKMKIIHNYYADTVVYQSVFSKLAWERLCKKKKKKWVIIYNGVDTQKIGVRKMIVPTQYPIKLLTYGEFRRREQIEPLIESVKLLDPEQFSLDIYGPHTKNLAHLFEFSTNQIHFKEKKDHAELLALISQYDLFLFSDQSACPNSVLEALAAGLPVVAFDRGSIRELVQSEYDGLIVPLSLSHDPFSHPYPFIETDYHAFSKAIETASRSKETWSAHAREEAKKNFSLEKMMRAYMSMFE